MNFPKENLGSMMAGVDFLCVAFFSPRPATKAGFSAPQRLQKRASDDKRERHAWQTTCPDAAG
ncbi:MAG: hypothetical protein LBF51_07225 [Zoogloeaceae bacterium]|nr:hypothetical protein [Zoogloeaceae bacterium]